MEFDDAVVPTSNFPMCGFIKFFSFFGVPHFPIEGQVARRFRRDVRVPWGSANWTGNSSQIQSTRPHRMLHRIGNNHPTGRPHSR